MNLSAGSSLPPAPWDWVFSTLPPIGAALAPSAAAPCMALWGWGCGCCVLCCTPGLGGLLHPCFYFPALSPQCRLLAPLVPHPAGLQFIPRSASIKEEMVNKKPLYDMSSKCLFKSSKDKREGGNKNQRKIWGREIKASEELYGVFYVTLSVPKSGLLLAVVSAPSSACRAPALLQSTCSCALLNELHSRSTHFPFSCLQAKGRMLALHCLGGLRSELNHSSDLLSSPQVGDAHL